MKIPVVLCCMMASAALHAQNNITTAARERYFDVVRASIEGSAEVMPAEKYSFRLTPAQRTFAEWLVHSIERNYRDCAVLRGEPTQPGARESSGYEPRGDRSVAAASTNRSASDTSSIAASSATLRTICTSGLSSITS